MKTQLIKKIKQISAEYKFGDFFRNFIAVVLGIVLTFAGSDWITERNTQKEVEKSLLLVKSELLLNREEMQAMAMRVSLEQKAASYLFEYKNKKSEISQDSVKRYLPLIFQWSKFTFTNDAMEMLKSSSLIHKIKNKELALQIIKAYGTIKAVQSAFNVYMDYKSQGQDEFNANPKVKAYAYNQTKKREKPDNFNKENLSLLDFLYTQPEGLSLLQTLPNILSSQIFFSGVEEISETIAAIEKEYQ